MYKQSINVVLLQEEEKQVNAINYEHKGGTKCYNQSTLCLFLIDAYISEISPDIITPNRSA